MNDGVAVLVCCRKRRELLIWDWGVDREQNTGGQGFGNGVAAQILHRRRRALKRER